MGFPAAGPSITIRTENAPAPSNLVVGPFAMTSEIAVPDQTTHGTTVRAWPEFQYALVLVKVRGTGNVHHGTHDTSEPF
jgi:hypothetical protein